MFYNFQNQKTEIGIYCICIDNIIVYIGQSKHLSQRAYSHKLNIRKGENDKTAWYNIANQFYLRGHDFSFRILEKLPENADLLKKRN